MVMYTKYKGKYDEVEAVQYPVIQSAYTSVYNKMYALHTSTVNIPVIVLTLFSCKLQIEPTFVHSVTDLNELFPLIISC